MNGAGSGTGNGAGGNWMRLEPGMMVKSPANPEWGLGQVQSAIGDKVTVNFEHGGKVVVHMGQAVLTPVYDL